jgi:hypothetical protein
MEKAEKCKEKDDLIDQWREKMNQKAIAAKRVSA